VPQLALQLQEPQLRALPPVPLQQVLLQVLPQVPQRLVLQQALPLQVLLDLPQPALLPEEQLSQHLLTPSLLLSPALPLLE
jgi:hypothetical protein